MTKKYGALFLVGLLSLSLLTGCGNSSNNSSATPSPSPSVIQTATPAPAAEATPPTNGVWQDRTFTNTWANYSFTLPKKWSKISVADLKKQIGTTSFLFNEDATQSQVIHMNDAAAYYDCGILSSDVRSNVLICFENLSRSPLKDTITEDLYFAAIVPQLKATGQYSSIDEDPSDYTLAGQSYRRLTARHANSNATQWYLARRQDDIMICWIVTVTASEQKDMESFLQSISSVQP